MNKSDDLANLSDDEILQMDDTQESYSEPKEESNQDYEVSEETQEEKEQADVNQESESSEEQEPSPEYYKEFYHKVMSPFKADGIMITPENENDIISLMQKGANYTKKMQAISAQRKAIDALQRENMLDQIPYMIDLKHGNPDAIRKLLKDNKDKFDVYDADLDDVQYTPKELPEIDEQQIALEQTFADLYKIPEGVAVINDSVNWDKQSRLWLYDKPDILRTMTEQRKSGIYQKVLEEIDNMDALGRFEPNTPFLQKYGQVGEKLVKLGVIPNTPVNQPYQQPQQPQPQQQQIITRGSSQVSNHSRARSAGITRNSNGTTNILSDPSNMSDEEFLKTYASRL